MLPTVDPGMYYAVVRRKRELVIVPLSEVGVMRLSESKGALKKWRRSFEFHKRKAENGRKEVSNGNSNC